MSFSLHDVSIYYINDDEHKDKKESIESILSQYKLKFKRKALTSVSKLSLPFQSIDEKEKRFTQSYIEIMKEFLSSDKQYLMIMKDDIKFRDDWIGRLNKKLATLNNDDPNWHCLFLYTSEGIKHYTLCNTGVPMDEEDKKLYHTWRKIKEEYGSSCMLFSKKGVQTFYLMFNEYTGYNSVDWMNWCLQTKNHCYGIFPWLVCIIKKGDNDPNFDKAMRLLKESDYDYSNYT